MGVRPLNHALWSLGARAPRAKHQNRIRQGVRRYDFISRRIVRKAVNRASQKRILPGDHPGRRRISVCQPGKHRDARLGHSIGN
jgi:hypothetical protein